MSYTGIFATNCAICHVSSAQGAANQMSRSRHISRNAVTSIQVAFPNWKIPYTLSSWLETAGGAALTLTATIEYGGVSTQFLWSSSASVVIADGTTSALSDPLSITIPAGDAFFIRSYVVGNDIYNQIPSAHAADTDQGEQYTFNGGVDETLSTGNILNGTPLSTIYRPILLVASLPSTAKSFLLLGDSVCAGYNDLYAISQGGNTSSDHGVTGRVTGAKFGYVNCGTNSDSGTRFIASHTKRVALAAYVSHVISEYGIVDLENLGPDVAAANLATIFGYFTKPVYQTTITPLADSTDAWATLGNQTPAFQTDRATLNNTYIRPIAIAGQTGVVEVADILESARDSDKWAVNGTANWYTADGTHPTNTADIAVQAGLANTPLFSTNVDTTGGGTSNSTIQRLDSSPTNPYRDARSREQRRIRVR